MISGQVRSIHFIGICGTAMASTAAALQERGYLVTGSDENVYPPMSTFLESRRIPIMAGYSAENLRHDPDLVVVGNVIRRGNPEVEAMLEQKRRFISLPEALKEFFIRGRTSLVVTGTHGKTTTTSLLAWIMVQAGLNPSYMIGGIPNGLGQGAQLTDGKFFVIEGDEYDTAFFDKRSKFIHYLPDVLIINNLEFDHADIFNSLADIQLSFKRLINIVPRNGLIIANGDEESVEEVLSKAPCRISRFGIGKKNEWRAENLRCQGDQTTFLVLREGKTFGEFTIPLSGEHNVRNALATIIASHHAGVALPDLQRGVSSFQGIKRRQEIRATIGGITVIDDFGHHPTAIRETIRALRSRFPDRKIWAIFEPRSNTTRRKIFQKELAETLGEADAAIVGQVDRLNELPENDRLDPQKMVEEIQKLGREAAYVQDPMEISRTLVCKVKSPDVVVIFSNGSFGGLHQKFIDGLKLQQTQHMTV